MGHIIFIGFGTLLLITTIALVVIGVVAPDLFRTIVESLRELSQAIFPSLIRI